MAGQSQPAMPTETKTNKANEPCEDVLSMTHGALTRLNLQESEVSKMSMLTNKSIPLPGSILTGKQEHYMKRELISQQVKWEISELSHPTALQRFGAPFRSDAGEVAPKDSELPILRFIFNSHVRNFPFLDQAREKEFWQDKLQIFLESFATKSISSSEDRLEQTKRRKLALKAQKLVELMMVSGIPTASGYEERIRFAEIEVVDRGANEQGLVANAPHGKAINGWDVNIAGVRTTSVKRHIRHHQRAEYIIRAKRNGEAEVLVGRRYSDFARFHKRLRMEFPGKVVPPLPRRNTSNSLLPDLYTDDNNSISSGSSQGTNSNEGLRSYLGVGNGHKRRSSGGSIRSFRSSRPSVDGYPRPTTLYRETQRVTLRAFLRHLLQNEQVASSRSIADFLTSDPIKVNEEEYADIDARALMDEKRLEEQRQFYEIAQRRARELDVHMEKFRREIVEAHGLTHLFQEVRVKSTIAELNPEYKKFAEWLRIEVAATLYHLFLAEDNSPELFGLAKRVHNLIPYGLLKNVIRVANPAAVMSGVLNLFLAQPFGTRSLMQRILIMAISDSISQIQKTLDTLQARMNEPLLCERIRAYVYSEQETKDRIEENAEEENIEKMVVILKTKLLKPDLPAEESEKILNTYVAWNKAVENAGENDEMRKGAELFSNLTQVLKLLIRRRDKEMMLQMFIEPTTLQLFRDLFTIFYEPLVRVYKSANVYDSVTDFASFADDAIQVVEAARRQDVSADPNQTVQAFIDVCSRHEDNLYKFIHEVHTHDNGLFDQLMGWLQNILEFLRKGPKGGTLDMNAMLQDALDSGLVEHEKVVEEVNALVKWQTARKKWHQDKTRQKMANGGEGETRNLGTFGFIEDDIQDLELDYSDNSSEEDLDPDLEIDPIEAERRSRARDKLRRTAGEPVKPKVVELKKLRPPFVSMLRTVLAN